MELRINRVRINRARPVRVFFSPDNVLPDQSTPATEQYFCGTRASENKGHQFNFCFLSLLSLFCFLLGKTWLDVYNGPMRSLNTLVDSIDNKGAFSLIIETRSYTRIASNITRGYV